MPDTLKLQIDGMDCADCAVKLEKGIASLEGVTACTVNFATASMRIESVQPLNRTRVVRRIESLGYRVVEASSAEERASGGGLLRQTLRQPRNALTLAGLALILLAAASGPLGKAYPALLPAASIAAPVLFAVGGACGLYFPARMGWAALRSGQGLDINVLMTIATVSAFAIGEFAEAATVILLFSVGEALEGYTMERARNSIRALTSLAPSKAIRLTMGANGVEEEEVPVEALAIGDRILVKPGERIPMDGRVHKGQSGVNQAPITGESMPVFKSPGDEVFAGSINGDGTLEIEVTHLAQDNTLSRMIYLIEEAQSQKTPTQRFVDRFARWYTPAVVAAAILVAVVPPLFFDQPFFNTPAERGWLYRALTLLVIACPCALVIATPVAVVSAISTAARQGILIKGGAYLEGLGRLTVMAFDKTGTLTRGEPEVTAVQCADNCCEGAPPCAHCDAMVAAAAAVERHSTHPLAQAVVGFAAARGLPKLLAEGVENLPGHGIRGQVNQRWVTVGNHTLLHNPASSLADFCRRVSQTEQNGQTVMLIREEETLQGYLAVSDRPRPESRRALARLREVGIRHTVMLTGDNPAVAQHIARQVGVSEVRASLLPQDKISAVQELLAQHGNTVGMVGDGVNDAPALAAASVGIAMGAGGSAQAIEAADVALLSDDLSRLPFAVQLGRQATATIRFNIWFALAIKAIFLVGALFGAATLWMAVFADVGASLLVTLNGMRLLRVKP